MKVILTAIIANTPVPGTVLKCVACPAPPAGTPPAGTPPAAGAGDQGAEA